MVSLEGVRVEDLRANQTLTCRLDLSGGARSSFVRVSPTYDSTWTILEANLAGYDLSHTHSTDQRHVRRRILVPVSGEGSRH